MGIKRLTNPFLGTHDWYISLYLAGSFAGLSEHLSMLPLDNVKTHCQAGSNLSLTEIIRNIYRSGGLKNFYSGLSVMAMGCVPAHAIYFSIYEQAQKHINCQGPQNHYKFALVGIASSLFHDLVMTPTEVVKQRLQLIRSNGNEIKAHQLVNKMYKSEGLVSFYRSFGINYFMNVPFGSMIIFFNEKIKYLMKIKEKDSYFNYFTCAGLAGALASIPTCPFDVIKTRLNTQSCLNNSCEKKQVCQILKKVKIEGTQKIKTPKQIDPRIRMGISSQKPLNIKYKNVMDTASIIIKEQGVIGLFSGLKMRIAIQSMSSAVAWGTYQFVKNLIQPKLRVH